MYQSPRGLIFVGAYQRREFCDEKEEGVIKNKSRELINSRTKQIFCFLFQIFNFFVHQKLPKCCECNLLWTYKLCISHHLRGVAFIAVLVFNSC